MRKPFVTLNKQGSDVNLIDKWGDLFIGLTITDESGTESDKMSIEIDDLDGCVEYPKVGDTLKVSGGYKDDGAVIQGEYEVNGVELEGWPQKVTITGTAVSGKKKNKERKTEKHDEETDVKTVEDLAKKIAKRNGWELANNPDLKEITVEYEAQAAESDQAFMTRVGARFGLLVQVKQGKLIVAKKGEGKSASGKQVPPLVIERALNILTYKVSFKEKPKHGKVKAHTFDRKKVRKVEYEVGGDKDDENDVAYIYRKPFKNETELKRAIEAKARELERDEASATFEIEGDPEAAAERHIDVRNLRAGVDGLWNPTRVEHRWSTAGYITTLECETPDKKKEGSASNKTKGKKKSDAKPSGDASGGITV